jgi:NitT/TauT family transport system substrate-binding protein
MIREHQPQGALRTFKNAIASGRLKVASLLIVTGILSIAPTASAHAEKIILGVASPISFSFAPFIMAKDAGFLKAENLEIEIVSFGQGGGGSGALMPQVARGKVQIGWGGPSWLINARQPGLDYVPLKFFYNYNRRYGWEITALAGRGINKLTDLKGKAVGIPSPSGASVPILRAILNDVGLTPEKDVKFPVVGVGASAIRALQSGQVAAIDMIEIRRATLQMRGMKLVHLKAPAKFQTIPSASFISGDAFIKSKPAVLVGWGRAIAKATIFCHEKPDACVTAFWTAYPSSKPAGAEKRLGQFAAMLKEKIEGQMPSDNEQFGAFSTESWQTYLAILHDAGEIKSKDVKLDTLYTDRFLATINSFDRSSIRRMAREWKAK